MVGFSHDYLKKFDYDKIFSNMWSYTFMLLPNVHYNSLGETCTSKSEGTLPYEDKYTMLLTMVCGISYIFEKNC